MNCRLATLILSVVSSPLAFSEVSFSRQIAPILLEKCVTCHGPEKSKGGFRIDTYAALTQPGDSKKASLKSGSPSESHLYELLTTDDEDDRMPQKADRLPDAQITLIRDWITEGAKFDGASTNQSLTTLVPFQPGPAPLPHYPFPQPVLSLAWSADGKQIASSGYHEALIWNDSGKLTKRVSHLPQRIHGLAFAENKLAIACGTPGKSGEVLLSNLESSEPPRLLARLADVAIALAINKDRTLLAAGGADNSIHLFELPSGRELYSSQQHADWVTALVFSPDSSQIASASRDRTARIIETKTGALIETYPEHNQALFAVAFSADGKHAFSGGREKKAHAWQINDSKKLDEFPALEGDVLALCLVDKTLFASGADKRILQFNSEDRKLTRTLTGHKDWVYSLAWNEATKRLASGSYDGEIRLWNLEQTEAILAFKAAP